jgi:hypothetical protein
MKLAVTFAAVMILASAGLAGAQSPTQSAQLPDPVVMSETVISPNTPTYTRSTRRNYSSSQQSLFGRMMELERRKNAWFRRTFLGR